MTPIASHAKPYWDPAKQLGAPNPHGTVAIAYGGKLSKPFSKTHANNAT